MVKHDKKKDNRLIRGPCLKVQLRNIRKFKKAGENASNEQRQINMPKTQEVNSKKFSIHNSKKNPTKEFEGLIRN